MNTLIEKYKKYSNFRLAVQLLFILVLSRVVMLIMVPVYNGIMGTHRSFSFLMNEWDAKRYQFMIDNGYTFPLDTDPQANWAFFPMYVIVCQFVKLLTFWKADTYWVGMFVSNMCIYIAAYFGIKWLRDRYEVNNGTQPDINNNYGILLGILMFMAPYSFYCASVYTEAMFIMFIVLFFYFSQKKQWLIAGLMSAFASATRIVGCTLVFALIIELYLDYKNKNTVMYVDEAHILLSGNNELGAEYLAQMQRRARKYNTGTIIITQQPTDFAADNLIVHGKAIFDNASYYLIMGLRKQAVEDLSKLIDLNENEKESIKTYTQGEALFVCGSRRMRINVILTQDELDSFGSGGGL